MTLPFEPSPYTQIALLAATKAGHLLKRGFSSTYQVYSKPGKHNLVTEYDQVAEKLIIDTIRERFPSHGFLAEESGTHASSSSTEEIVWVIDPLDGTVNFAHRLPIFCVSIAATRGHEILTGVIYQPMTDELFVAEKGQGAFLNETRLHVTRTPQLTGAICAAGFSFNAEHPSFYIEVALHLNEIGVPMRDIGSAALHLAYVAAGCFDAFWYDKLYAWDIAAGTLLVEEAGGKVTSRTGAALETLHVSSLLASNGYIHADLLQLLRRE